MNLPTGVDPGYGLCLLWLLLDVALYAVLHQMGSLDSVRDVAAKKTFSRLDHLNEFLTRRFDQWTGPAQGGTGGAQFINDYASLIELRRAVNEAAWYSSMSRNRDKFEEIGRAVVALSMLGPFATGAGLVASVDRVQLGMLALGTFAVLTSMILVAVLFAHVARLRIVSGQDA